MDNPKIGQRVSYEDMENPRQEGTITEIKNSRWGGIQYVVQFDDEEEPVWSDLLQTGWTRAYPDCDCGCMAEIAKRDVAISGLVAQLNPHGQVNS